MTVAETRTESTERQPHLIRSATRTTAPSARRANPSRPPSTSAEWRDYFEQNLRVQRIDWNIAPRVDMRRDRKLLHSMQAWQLGETSEAKHLLRAASLYAKRQDDPAFLEAVKLFIREEQKHGENLGQYLDRVDMPRVRWDWGDWLFRRVRGFNYSMEVWTVTVIAVEIFAQLYYKALKDAVGCPLLSAVCNDILIDEVRHIQFQSERLQVMLQSRSAIRRSITVALYWRLFGVITLAVWLGHGIVFRRSGLTFATYRRIARRKFRRGLGKS